MQASYFQCIIIYTVMECQFLEINLDMASKKFNFCFLIFFLSYGIISTQCLGNICLPKEHVALFVFGDSLFDVGNNNYINTTTDYQANFSPYGETFFKFPTGRFSNGRVIPDFIGKNTCLFGLTYLTFLFYFIKICYA